MILLLNAEKTFEGGVDRVASSLKITFIWRFLTRQIFELVEILNISTTLEYLKLKQKTQNEVKNKYSLKRRFKI